LEDFPRQTLLGKFASVEKEQPKRRTRNENEGESSSSSAAAKKQSSSSSDSSSSCSDSSESSSSPSSSSSSSGSSESSGSSSSSSPQNSQPELATPEKRESGEKTKKKVAEPETVRKVIQKPVALTASAKRRMRRKKLLEESQPADPVDSHSAPEKPPGNSGPAVEPRSNEAFLSESEALAEEPKNSASKASHITRGSISSVLRAARSSGMIDDTIRPPPCSALREQAIHEEYHNRSYLITVPKNKRWRSVENGESQSHIRFEDAAEKPAAKNPEAEPAAEPAAEVGSGSNVDASDYCEEVGDVLRIKVMELTECGPAWSEEKLVKVAEKSGDPGILLLSLVGRKGPIVRMVNFSNAADLDDETLEVSNGHDNVDIEEVCRSSILSLRVVKKYR